MRDLCELRGHFCPTGDPFRRHVWLIGRSRDLRPEILPVPELGDWTEKALIGIAGYSDQEAAHFTER